MEYSKIDLYGDAGSGCWRADVIGIFGSDDAAVL